ncbi:MAG: sensor histidine kinase [Candidatus Saccharibacteria bacterium]
MKIRNKILIYFSSTVITLTGITFLIIYLFFSANREQEFQQRQKQKILTTLYLLTEIKKIDEKLIEAIDSLTINDLFDEKLLIFNQKKELIYSSLDDIPIKVSKDLLSKLNKENRWIKTKEGLYDVVGSYIEKNGNAYYGISKAYDTFGYSKLIFLRNVFAISFILITATLLLVSFYLSKRISKPLTALANLLTSYRLGEKQLPQNIRTTTFEITYLHEKFNELVKRTYEAFDYQKHTVHHMSHQLKTPIAVLISELERIKIRNQDENIKSDLENQIIKTKSLADIINILLEISKAESGQSIAREHLRVDEIIFDCIEELNTLYPDFNFEVNYIPQEPNVDNLVIYSNEMLIRQAMQNLLRNCIAYSDNNKAEIKIDCTQSEELSILISNTGQPVLAEEKKYLFDHFFRGENSRGKAGFGLGLVLTRKIMDLSDSSIIYSNPTDHLNVFELHFPLS